MSSSLPVNDCCKVVSMAASKSVEVRPDVSATEKSMTQTAYSAVSPTSTRYIFALLAEPEPTVEVSIVGAEVPGKLVDHLPSGELYFVHVPAGDGSGESAESRLREADGLGCGDAVSVGCAVRPDVGEDSTMALGAGLAPETEPPLCWAMTKMEPAATRILMPTSARAIGIIDPLDWGTGATAPQEARVS